MLPFDKLYNELVVPVSDLLAAFKALNRLIPISYGFKRRFVASNVFIDKYLPVFHANWVPAGYKLVPAGYKLVAEGHQLPPSPLYKGSPVGFG